MQKDYHVQIEVFEGPLDLLLQLIEKEKLSITEVSLAKVTDQFLSYMSKREQVPLAELSNFLSIAAKLILIKSRSLLPALQFTESEEESIEDLQLQLELYALFKEKAKNLQNMFEQNQGFAVREQFLGLEKVYFPPKNIGVGDLQNALQNFVGTLEYVQNLPQETLQKILSLEKRIFDIQALIAKQGSIVFSQMLTGENHKEEKIVSFLALLELVKQKFVFVEQSSHFKEMNIQKI